MDKQKYVRKGHVIKDMEGKAVFHGQTPDRKKQPSINAAKKESRRLQLTEGSGLGRGLVRAV
jgi:hypothetical protein